MRKFPCAAGFAMAAALMGGATADAAMIGVNFATGRNATTGGGTVTTSAGVVSQSNWNNLTGATGGQTTPVSIHDDSNAPAAAIAWKSTGTWSATGNANITGGDAALMSGYLDNFSAAGNGITVSDLGTEFTSVGYDVIVYFNADGQGTSGYTATDGVNSDTRWMSQGIGAGSNYPLAGGTNGYVESTATTYETATIGNYVRLRGLTGSSFTLTGLAAPTASPGDDRARPNGFQIVAVPEPAALGLLGLGGALAVRPRRQRRDDAAE